MELKQRKISELPEATRLDGLSVLGVDSENHSVKADIMLLKGNTGSFDPTAEFDQLATSDKTIPGAINEVAALACKGYFATTNDIPYGTYPGLYLCGEVLNADGSSYPDGGIHPEYVRVETSRSDGQLSFFVGSYGANTTQYAGCVKCTNDNTRTVALTEITNPADSLTSALSSVPLSANMGRVLNEKITNCRLDTPAFEVNAFQHRILGETPSRIPDYKALNRLYRRLTDIDPTLCSLAAPELTGWQNGTTGLTKLYELFGNDYVQETAVKQPTGVQATAPLLVSDGTVRTGADASAGEEGSIILRNTTSVNTNYWSYAGWDKTEAFCGIGGSLIDFDADCNVDGVTISAVLYKIFGSGNVVKVILKSGKHHYQVVSNFPVIDMEGFKSAWFGLYKKTSTGAYPANDTEGLELTISNVSVSYAPADGYTDPMGRALFPQIWFDGSDDELANTPIDLPFTGYAPVATPGNSFTVSAAPAVRVAFASVHDAAKQAQVIAALDDAFGTTFETQTFGPNNISDDPSVQTSAYYDASIADGVLTLFNGTSTHASIWGYAGFKEAALFNGIGAYNIAFDADCNVDGATIVTYTSYATGAGVAGVVKATTMLSLGKKHYTALCRVSQELDYPISTVVFQLYKSGNAYGGPENDTAGLQIEIRNVTVEKI